MAPITSISYHQLKIRLELRTIGNAFEGTLAKDGSELCGDWLQGGGSLPLRIQKSP